MYACSYQGATAPGLCLKLHLSLSSLRLLLEGYQKSCEKRCQNHCMFSFLLKHKYLQQFHNILHLLGSWAGRYEEAHRNPLAWYMCSNSLLTSSCCTTAWWSCLVRGRWASLLFSPFSVQDLHCSIGTASSLAALWLPLVIMSHFHLIKKL